MQKRFFKGIDTQLDSLSMACYVSAMGKGKKTTIRDVAAAAKLSVTTVSDALSGKGRLPDATRLKIKAIAEQLNYRPSAIARGLQGKGLGLVAISIAPVDNDTTLIDVAYWAAFVTHISQALLSAGYAPVLLPHDVDMLGKFDLPLDGAVVVDPLEHDPVLALFERKGIRCLTVGRDLAREGGLWIDDDTAEGVQRLLNETVFAGSKVAVLVVGPNKSYVVDAIAGAESWAAESGGSIVTIRCGGLDTESVSNAVRQAISNGAKALLAKNDRLAMQALAALRQQDVRVPEDVRLLSAGDAIELEQTSPGVSAARQHPARLAEMAAKTLRDAIHGKKVIEHLMLPMELVIRSSAPRI
jgi:DNA-binding LacI/PurR family transcriptional regulator